MRELNGKVAVVTGGANGIGFAIAERFGAAGMKLVIADIEPDAITRALARLGARGVEVIGVRTDVSRFADVEALARSTLEAFGRVHVVVNNAGVSITGPISELSLDDWRWVYDVNLWGVIHGIKAFVPTLVAQGEGGHVINVASLASFVGTGEHAPYCSSKAACLSISQALYSEMTARVTGVGVSVVCPGMVATDIHRSWRNRPKQDQPWSDREWNDAGHVALSSDVQGAGIEPERIAEATLDALREDRFYVFYGSQAAVYVANAAGPAIRAENPPVLTWGPDLRPKQPSAADAAR